jgi:hypothetical protein
VESHEKEEIVRESVVDVSPGNIARSEPIPKTGRAASESITPEKSVSTVEANRQKFSR